MSDCRSEVKLNLEFNILCSDGPEQNKPCVFPFQYQGKEYFECTMKDNESTYWCGTTYSVTTDAGWGVCTSSCISDPGISLIRISVLS